MNEKDLIADLVVIYRRIEFANQELGVEAKWFFRPLDVTFTVSTNKRLIPAIEQAGVVQRHVTIVRMFVRRRALLHLHRVVRVAM